MCCRYVFNKEPVSFRNLFTIWYGIYFEGTESLVKKTYKFSAIFLSYLYISLFYVFKESDARRITAAEMKYMRRTAGYTWDRLQNKCTNCKGAQCKLHTATLDWAVHRQCLRTLCTTHTVPLYTVQYTHSASLDWALHTQCLSTLCSTHTVPL